MKRIALVLAAVGAIGMSAGCKKEKKTDMTTDQSAKPTDSTGTAPAGGTATEPSSAAAPAGGAAEPAAGAAGGTAGSTEPAAGGAAGSTGSAEPAAGGAAGAEAASTGISECDSYIKRLMSCEKYPQTGKDALKQSTDSWKKAAEQGGDAAKAAADACKKAEEAADQSLKSMGC